MTPTESRRPAVEGRSSAPIAIGLALWSGAHVLLALPWAYAGEGRYHPWALAVTWALRYGGAAMALVAACRLARRLMPRITAGRADGPSGSPRPRPRLRAPALVSTGLALMVVNELPSFLAGSAVPLLSVLLLVAGYAGVVLIAAGAYLALRRLEDQLGRQSPGSPTTDGTAA